MAFGGATLVALLDGFDFSGRNPLGTVAMLAATFSYALYMVSTLSHILTSSFWEVVVECVINFCISESWMLCVLPEKKWNRLYC